MIATLVMAKCVKLLQVASSCYSHIVNSNMNFKQILFFFLMVILHLYCLVIYKWRMTILILTSGKQSVKLRHPSNGMNTVKNTKQS